MNWKKTGRIVRGNGETTIIYEAKGCSMQTESRKRAIPHAGGRPGHWMHTSYFLIDSSGKESEFFSLKDAKDAAEMAHKLEVRW